MGNKIFARALSTQLDTVLDHMIYPDESYSVPGQSVHDIYPADLQKMRKCQEIYSVASSTEINWSKCLGLPVGPWQMDPLPEELQCYTTHLLYLRGHFCPAEEFWPAFWQELKNTVTARPARWTGLLQMFPYRVRVLVINQLVAAMLWYRLTMCTFYGLEEMVFHLCPTLLIDRQPVWGRADKATNLHVALPLGLAINMSRQRTEEGLVVPDLLPSFAVMTEHG
eukprot:g40858.t1